MPTYKQWIMPHIATSMGYIEVRINTGLYGYDGGKADPPLTAADIITLNEQIIVNIGALKKSFNNEEGKLVVDSLKLNLRDRYSYSGVSNGSPVSEDLGASNSSLLNKIFETETNVDGSPYVYEVWMSHTVSGVTEVFFVGDTVALEMPYEHKGLHNVHTSTEEQQQQSELTIRFAIDRLASKTVDDLANTISAIDCQDGYFFPGHIEDPTASTVAKVVRYDADGLDTNSNSFPLGLWGIRIQTLADKLAALVGADSFDTITGAFRYFYQKWDGQKYALQTSDEKTVQDLYVSYNHLFNKPILDDLTLNEDPAYRVSFPCALGQEKALTEVIKWLCFQFGCVFAYSIDSTGSLTLKLLPRRESTGSLPANFKLTKSKEEQRQLSKHSVTVNNKGDEDKIIAGDSRRETISIEIPWRTHQWGYMDGDYSATLQDFYNVTPEQCRVWNTKLERKNQYLCFRIEQRDDTDGIINKHSSDGWLGGSVLYFYSSSDPDIYAPNNLLWDDGKEPQAGFYGLALTIPKDWDLPTDKDGDGYFNTTKSAAQWYYQELIGDRAVVSRDYAGFTDDSNSIQGVSLGIQTSFRLRGANRTFRAIEIEQDLIKGTTKIKWLEVPADYNSLKKPAITMSLPKQASGGSSGGSASGTNGDTAASGDYVSRHPRSDEANKIFNQYPSNVPLSIQAAALQDADLFQIKNSSGITLTFADNAGKFHTPATTSGDSSDTLTTLGFVTNTFVHRSPDDALKAKIKSSVSSGTVDTVTIEANGTNSGRLIVFNNNSGVTKTWVDAGGSLYTNASFSANGGIVTTTIAASGKITSDNTTSGDPSNTTTTKGYVDGLFASITGYVVLSPSNNTTNIVKPTGSGISNIRLQGATAGTANILLQFENNSSSAITGGMDSFGRAYFGEIPSTREIQTYVVAKDDLHTGLYVRGGTGSNSSPASLVQIDMKAAVSGRQWAFLVQPNGEMQAGWGASFGVAFKSANFTLDHTAVLWVVNAGSGAINATLPSASTCPGRVYVIERSNGAGGAVNVVRATGETIGRVAANKALGAAGASITLQSDGLTNWAII